tara:strand:+ start:1685 stop:2488 length:804 start_codon:yes stop_codon:yes gene_type:complete
MAIYDCFQYFNEDHILDLRFNILDKYVDYFVISESTKTHQGLSKKLNFKSGNFPKFKHKIKYIIADYKIEKNFTNHVGGESEIEKHQRNEIYKGLTDAHDNDLIILSDSDEIPDLKKINKIKKNTKYTAFSQKMFMYKLNLQNLNETNWIGSKLVLKKNISSMQNLRDLKFKKYPFWRVDKYNLQIINGGWHFSFLQSPVSIAEKIKSYSHGEYNTKKLTDVKSIEYKIKNNLDIFDRGYDLKKVLIDGSFPEYISNNKDKLANWII